MVSSTNLCQQCLSTWVFAGGCLHVQPPGFEKHDESNNVLVYKQHLNLYGLKQAPRAWFERLKFFLVNH